MNEVKVVIFMDDGDTDVFNGYIIDKGVVMYVIETEINFRQYDGKYRDEVHVYGGGKFVLHCASLNNKRTLELAETINDSMIDFIRKGIELTNERIKRGESF